MAPTKSVAIDTMINKMTFRALQSQERQFYDIIIAAETHHGRVEFDAAFTLLYYTFGPPYRPMMSLSNLHGTVGRIFVCQAGIMMKQCSRCKQVKPLYEFSKNRSRTDGIQQYCKVCMSEYAKLRPNYREKNKVYARSDAHKEADRRWRAKKPDAVKEKSRLWRENNPERSKAQSQKWRTNNPERAKELESLWRKQNKDRMLTHVHARNARIKGNGGKYTVSEWRSLCEKYDHRCLCCGKREPEVKLTVDHVIPLIEGGSNSIENIQPLCMFCNRRKGCNTIDYRR